MSLLERPEPVLFIPMDVADLDYGDPADYGFPTAAENPSRQFESLGVGTVSSREEVVAHMTVLGHGSFPLTDEFRRRVVVTQNKTTGQTWFVTPSAANFGWDELTEYDVPQTWNEGEVQDEGTFAFEAELPEARAPRTSVREKILARGGDPEFRSSFRYPTIGLPRSKRTGKFIFSQS